MPIDREGFFPECLHSCPAEPMRRSAQWGTYSNIGSMPFIMKRVECIGWCVIDIYLLTSFDGGLYDYKVADQF